jgi:hypothetical protein
VKNNIAMKIQCEECKIKYSIPNDKTFFDYNIYFVLEEGQKGGLFRPHLLCPKCTKALRK